ncbi:MAG: DUF456 domain-containing protein [Treponema sp.]|nr:DUF456 domain-containing protein [Treponema sp.]
MESISFSITAVDILLIVLTFLLVFLGIVGCIIPGLAGTPLCWGGMLASYFVESCNLSLATLIVCAVITVLVEVVNNFVPSFFTVKAGGSKAGSLGAIVGTFAGLFFGGFIGILAGPFVGAFIGELIHDRSDVKRAIKSAAFAFLGFVTGTGLRLIVACAFVIVLIHAYLAN